MRLSIELAKTCQPVDPKRTPKLGVVFAKHDSLLAFAKRGTGKQDDDDHAELIASKLASSQDMLIGSTVYTTLEPCTDHTRRSTSESCSTLLERLKVKKVVIGILDPNQAVCGRGFNQLQNADIEVEMYPHDLAKEVRAGNSDFLQAQQRYSPKIISPKPNEVFTLEKNNDGEYITADVVFESNLPPQGTVSLIVQQGNLWWPQRYGISETKQIQTADVKQYKGKVGFGSAGNRTIHIVNGNSFGVGVIDFYHEVSERNKARRNFLREKGVSNEVLNVHSIYHALKFSVLPNGLDSLASVTVEIKKAQ